MPRGAGFNSTADHVCRVIILFSTKNYYSRLIIFIICKQVQNCQQKIFRHGSLSAVSPGRNENLPPHADSMAAGIYTPDIFPARNGPPDWPSLFSFFLKEKCRACYETGKDCKGSLCRKRKLFFYSSGAKHHELSDTDHSERQIR